MNNMNLVGFSSQTFPFLYSLEEGNVHCLRQALVTDNYPDAKAFYENLSAAEQTRLEQCCQKLLEDYPHIGSQTFFTLLDGMDRIISRQQKQAHLNFLLA